MTRAVALLLWCAALFVPASAAADPRLVPDVSSRAIEIPYSRSEEHTSELQSLMRISYAVFCLKKTNASTPGPNTAIVNSLRQDTHTNHNLTNNLLTYNTP